MTISPSSTIPPSSVTTIEDWRPLLEERAVARPGHITIPLELRLILLTTTVVLILVTLGAQLTSVIRGSQAIVSMPTRAADLSALPYSWQPDGACYTPPADGRMISARDLASPYTSGIREVAPGVYHPCQMYGLVYPQPTAGAPATSGQVILISLSQQWLWAYQDGALVFANPVATGMRYLRTPQGTFHITYKVANVTFYSPWPRSSPFYYTPEQVNYALHFRAGGFYIHDAPWRRMFGSGAQDPHATLDGGTETGSHGCVNMTTSATAWLYQWANVGATVEVVA